MNKRKSEFEDEELFKEIKLNWENETKNPLCKSLENIKNILDEYDALKDPKEWTKSRSAAINYAFQRLECIFKNNISKEKLEQIESTETQNLENGVVGEKKNFILYLKLSTQKHLEKTTYIQLKKICLMVFKIWQVANYNWFLSTITDVKKIQHFESFYKLEKEIFQILKSIKHF